MAFSLPLADVIDLGSLSISNYPFTMAGWFRVPNTTTLMHFMRIDNTATGSYHMLYYGGHSTGWAGAASYAGNIGVAKSSASLVVNQWHHIAGVFSANNLREVYLDGGNLGTSSNTRNFDGVDQFRIGNTSTTDGIDVAEAAIFDVALTATEIAALAAGCSPFALPSAPAILSYKDCIRRIDRPTIGPVATSAGTPAIVSHPRVLAATGGRSTAMPDRVRGPWQLDQGFSRTSAAPQAQPSIAGAASDSTRIYGEVLS